MSSLSLPPDGTSGTPPLTSPTSTSLMQAEINEGIVGAQNILNTLKAQGYTDSQLKALEAAIAQMTALPALTTSNSDSTTASYNQAIQSFSNALESLSAEYPTITLAPEDFPTPITETTGSASTVAVGSQDFSTQAESLLNGYISDLKSAATSMTGSQLQLINQEISNLQALEPSSPLSGSAFSSFLTTLQSTLATTNSSLASNGCDVQLSSYALAADMIVASAYTQLQDLYENLSPSQQQSLGPIIDDQMQTLSELTDSFFLPNDSGSFASFLTLVQDNMNTINTSLADNGVNSNLICYNANAYALIESYLSQMNSSFSDLSATNQTNDEPLFTMMQSRLTSLLQDLVTNPLTSANDYNTFTETLQTTLSGINNNFASNQVDIQIVPYTSNAILLINNFISQLQEGMSGLSSSQQNTVLGEINTFQNMLETLSSSPLTNPTAAASFFNNLQTSITAINQTLSAQGISTQLDTTALNVQIAVVTDMINITSDEAQMTADQTALTAAQNILATQEALMTKLQNQLTAAEAEPLTPTTQQVIKSINQQIAAAGAQIETDTQNVAAAQTALTSNTSALAAAKTQLISDLTKLIPPNTPNFLQSQQLILETTLLFESQNGILSSQAKLQIDQTLYNAYQEAMQQFLQNNPKAAQTGSPQNTQYIQMVAQTNQAYAALQQDQKNAEQAQSNASTAAQNIVSHAQSITSQAIPTLNQLTTNILNQTNVYGAGLTQTALQLPADQRWPLSSGLSTLNAFSQQVVANQPQNTTQNATYQTLLQNLVSQINNSLQNAHISPPFPNINSITNAINSGSITFSATGVPSNAPTLNNVPTS